MKTLFIFAASALLSMPPMPPSTTTVLRSPKDAGQITAPLTATAIAPMVTGSNQPPIAVIQWHIAPGAADADSSLTNGVHCDIFPEPDGVRLEFFNRSNQTYEVQVKAEFWESVWRVVLRFDPDGLRQDGVLKVRYPFGQVPTDVPTRFFRVMSN